MWNSFFHNGKPLILPPPGAALPGPQTPLPLPERHTVFGTPLTGPFPGCETAYFGLGCFWGAERLFWRQPGIVSTAVGYAGGQTPNPTYREVCSGLTGHTEIVQVVFDPRKVSFERLLALFWESHDPTQGMRQGNDVGTQYRSAIYTTTPAQAAAARRSYDEFGLALVTRGFGPITTELRDEAPPFYFAEVEHQQYLDKNPDGYCGLAGTGLCWRPSQSSNS